MPSHITKIRFANYKTFRSYLVSLGGFNILVGPNNAGKSTVIGALRILSEGIKKAHSRKAEYLDTVIHRGFGYRIDLEDLPISTENIFTDYDETEPARIDFDIAPSGKLSLIFPEPDTCILVADTGGKVPQTPTEFKKEFDLSLSFVPVLGPVEHNEQMFQFDAARRALQNHRASRNFRNIWYYYPDNFEGFQNLIEQTWPGVSIRPPELTHDSGVPRLHMFYEERRVTREMYWSGFGFQAWCQMLTFVAKSNPTSLLVIDEPDIYLHSDLQRQLIQVLRDRGGDVLIATHSTEMLSEAESGEIVVIDRSVRSSRKISKPLDLANVFTSLGSVLNPILTQLSKTRRVVFVEGGDFLVIGAFARKLGLNALANQSGFAVVPAYGFNPARVRDFSDGMERSLGYPVMRAVIFDRDYRLDEEVARICSELKQDSQLAWVHGCKEIENFLLVPDAIHRCVQGKLRDREKRGAKVKSFSGDIQQILVSIADEMKADIFGQFSAKISEQIKRNSPGIDQATIHSMAHRLFEERWNDSSALLKIIPGKKVLARLNEVLQADYSVAVSPRGIVAAMQVEEVPQEMKELIEALGKFSLSKRA